MKYLYSIWELEDDVLKNRIILLKLCLLFIIDLTTYYLAEISGYLIIEELILSTV